MKLALVKNHSKIKVTNGKYKGCKGTLVWRKGRGTTSCVCRVDIKTKDGDKTLTLPNGWVALA